MREHLSEHKGWDHKGLMQDRYEMCLSHPAGFIFNGEKEKTLQKKHFNYLFPSLVPSLIYLCFFKPALIEYH